MDVPSDRFSFRTRLAAVEKLKNDVFDILVIGGGITGAAVARDAASRGLKVALIEKKDFAWGTSSRSSKLIHGGLRYLENFEFKLVFEALAERALLLKTAGNRVRPLPFYFPVYQSDPHGMDLMSVGFWLYDLLALFRTPGAHRRLSRKKLLADVPYLRAETLKGGFRYYDASMWDDSLVIETLRSAHGMGATVASQIEALRPCFQNGKLGGFAVADHFSQQSFRIHAHKTIVCAGPWTDVVGQQLDSGWKAWLSPSKGTHLVFDWKKIPVPGAIVMSHPKDGRISFVIPRPDFGAGVTIVGTTDGPHQGKPDDVSVDPGEVTYLMDLLHRYLPGLGLEKADILSAYVGIRPLYSGGSDAEKLQTVSREHFIGTGPGGSVVVAGGKYTTSRTMGQEIVDFCLKSWRDELRGSGKGYFPNTVRAPKTKEPINPSAMPRAIEETRVKAQKEGLGIPERLIELLGADALEVAKLAKQYPSQSHSPDGFPEIEAMLRWSIRNEMVLHLEDFYFRRVPLYLALPDHGVSVLDRLALIWGEELGQTSLMAERERKSVLAEIHRRKTWVE
jgi:glycerol-3-phosphate dehydrogenase